MFINLEKAQIQATAIQGTRVGNWICLQPGDERLDELDMPYLHGYGNAPRGPLYALVDRNDSENVLICITTINDNSLGNVYGKATGHAVSSRLQPILWRVMNVSPKFEAEINSISAALLAGTELDKSKQAIVQNCYPDCINLTAPLQEYYGGGGAGLSGMSSASTENTVFASDKKDKSEKPDEPEKDKNPEEKEHEQYDELKEQYRIQKENEKQQKQLQVLVRVLQITTANKGKLNGGTITQILGFLENPAAYFIKDGKIIRVEDAITMDMGRQIADFLKSDEAQEYEISDGARKKFQLIYQLIKNNAEQNKEEKRTELEKFQNELPTEKEAEQIDKLQKQGKIQPSEKGHTL